MSGTGSIDFRQCRENRNGSPWSYSRRHSGVFAAANAPHKPGMASKATGVNCVLPVSVPNAA